MAKTANRRKKRTGAKRASPAKRGGMAHWYLIGAAVVGGVLYMDNAGLKPEAAVSAIRTASIDRKEQKVAVPTPKVAVARKAEQAMPAAEKLPPFSGKWFICTTQTDYCVVDGSTLLYAGRKVRLADIDTPAITGARCDAERSRGGDAKLRLREILNEGEVTLVEAKGKTGERAGAAPRLVLRDGRSIGGRLVREGLARPWTGRHQSWCG